MKNPKNKNYIVNANAKTICPMCQTEDQGTLDICKGCATRVKSLNMPNATREDKALASIIKHGRAKKRAEMFKKQADIIYGGSAKLKASLIALKRVNKALRERNKY